MDIKTITYDFTLLANFSEVCRTARETALYNKYFPEFAKRFGTEIIYPGAYRIVLTESNGTILSMTYERVYYSMKQIIKELFTSFIKK